MFIAFSTHFSQRNHGLHESTQICHESTEEDFKWLNAVQ